MKSEYILNLKEELKVIRSKKHISKLNELKKSLEKEEEEMVMENEKIEEEAKFDDVSLKAVRKLDILKLSFFKCNVLQDTDKTPSETGSIEIDKNTIEEEIEQLNIDNEESDDGDEIDDIAMAQFVKAVNVKKGD